MRSLLFLSLVTLAIHSANAFDLKPLSEQEFCSTRYSILAEEVRLSRIAMVCNEQKSQAKDIFLEEHAQILEIYKDLISSNNQFSEKNCRDNYPMPPLIGVCSPFSKADCPTQLAEIKKELCK